jgi:hypothetical protein
LKLSSWAFTLEEKGIGGGDYYCLMKIGGQSGLRREDGCSSEVVFGISTLSSGIWKR